MHVIIVNPTNESLTVELREYCNARNILVKEITLMSMYVIIVNPTNESLTVELREYCNARNIPVKEITSSYLELNVKYNPSALEVNEKSQLLVLTNDKSI